MRFSDIPTRRRRGLTTVTTGVLALLVIAVALYLAFSRHNPFADPFELNALFPDANRLRERSPVRIAGVDVGRVVGVEPLADGSGLARVTMEIRDEGLPIREDARLKIRSRLFLEGNYFVDVQPGQPASREVDDGDTIPVDQTASPVQFNELLTALQSDTRADLQRFLREYSVALKGAGARGFNTAIRHWEDAYRTTSQVNDATLGWEPHDLTRVLDGQSRVFGALSRDEQTLEELVSDLNETFAGFARREERLRAAIPALRDVFRDGRPALASLNRALPEIAGFARDALPGVRSAPPTLAALIPFVRQARRLVSEPELGGLSRQLRATVPILARLNRRAVLTFEQTRALAACQTRVLVPFARTPIDDPDFPYHSGEPFFEEAPRALVGLAGESRLADANSQFFHIFFGSGATSLVSTGETGETLFAQLDVPARGVRPARPTGQPRFRPDVPCETQDPPNMDAPVGPAGEQTRADGDPRKAGGASRRRERARPAQYRRLREFAQATRLGRPALDPFVWSPLGERLQLERLGFSRVENGRLVERRER